MEKVQNAIKRFEEELNDLKEEALKNASKYQGSNPYLMEWFQGRASAFNSALMLLKLYAISCVSEAQYLEDEIKRLREELTKIYDEEN